MEDLESGSQCSQGNKKLILPLEENKIDEKFQILLNSLSPSYDLALKKVKDANCSNQTAIASNIILGAMDALDFSIMLYNSAVFYNNANNGLFYQ